MVTAEGDFPKVGNDPLYNSEINLMNGLNEYASGLPVSVPAGSTSLAGYWASTNGSIDSVTDNNSATYWEGTYVGSGINSAGSVVIDLGYSTYRNRLIFAGSITSINGGVNFDILGINSTTGSNIPIVNPAQVSNAASLNIAGSNFSVDSLHAIDTLSFAFTNVAVNGSTTLRLSDIKLI